MDNIVGKVASGLRNMKNKPDAFVFNDRQDDWTWDQETILDIPVFHIYLIIDLLFAQNKKKYTGIYDEVLFIPVWNTEDAVVQLAERVRFAEGYIEWKSDKELCKIADEEILENGKRTGSKRAA